MDRTQLPAAPLAVAVRLSAPALAVLGLAACRGAGTGGVETVAAAPTPQALELVLAPDAGTGTLEARAAWVFSARLTGPVDFRFGGPAPSEATGLRAFDGAGAELALEPTPTGFRVPAGSGTNRVVLELGAPAATGLAFPRAGGEVVGLVARASEGEPSAWLPVPAGAERVRVTTTWDLPRGWSAVAPESSRPLAVDGLVWAAGRWTRLDTGGGDGVAVHVDEGHERWGRAALASVLDGAQALTETLGAAPAPFALVFARGLAGADGVARPFAVPGAVLVPVEWLDDGRTGDPQERLADLAGALASQWVGTPAESGPGRAESVRGLAEHVGDWALGARLAPATRARRADRALADAARPAGAARGRALAGLLHRAAGDGPFAHALRTVPRGAEPDELVAALEKASGRELGPLAEPWIRGAGVPELALDWSYDAAARELVLEVSQRQAPTAGVPRVFRAEVEVEVADGVRIERRVIELDARTRTYRLPCAARPTWVVVDPAGVLPHRVVSTPDRNASLARADRATTPAGRVVALRELAQLARSAQSDDARRLLTTPLSNALLRDGSAWVRETAARELGVLGGLEARAVLERAARGDRDPGVRTAALGGLARWAPDPALARLAEEVFGENDAPWGVRIAAAELFAASDPARASVWLAERLALDSPHQVLRARLLDLWSRTGVPGVEETLAGWLADRLAADRVRATAARRLVELARAGRAEPAGLAGVLEDPDPRWRRAAVEALGRYRSSAARDALEAFAREASSRSEARLAEAALRPR